MVSPASCASVTGGHLSSSLEYVTGSLGTSTRARRAATTAKANRTLGVRCALSPLQRYGSRRRIGWSRVYFRRDHRDESLDVVERGERVHESELQGGPTLYLSAAEHHLSSGE